MSNETRVAIITYFSVLLVFSLLLIYHFYREGRINL